jgi:hypothetical protein
VFGEVAVAVVQADLGLPGALVGLRAGGGASWDVAVVPGGLDQQPACVAVAGLGDVAAMLLIAAGVLAGDDAQPRGQFAWVAEASEVADLCDQPQRLKGANTRFVMLRRGGTRAGDRRVGRVARFAGQR